MAHFNINQENPWINQDDMNRIIQIFQDFMRRLFHTLFDIGMRNFEDRLNSFLRERNSHTGDTEDQEDDFTFQIA